MLGRLKRLWCWLRWRHAPRAVWGAVLRFPDGALITEACRRCGLFIITRQTGDHEEVVTWQD